MKIEDLREVQKIQLKIMDEIHRICEQSGIRYYIIGGTALGAIRHGGFIPWDVDIDIAMHREDYERFIYEKSSLLDAKFECHHYKKDTDYYPPHALVALKNSELIQKDDYLNPNLKRYGIFIDIFPLDNAPDKISARNKQAKELKKKNTQKQRKIGITYSENSSIVKMLKKIVKLRYISKSWDRINSEQEKIMKRYSKEATSCWCSMASHYSYEKQCMPKEIYGEPTLIKFEDRYYYAPEMLDEYLKRIFDDYMKLPSKESQQKQLDYFVSAKWKSDIV